jgi:hypothetical protein
MAIKPSKYKILQPFEAWVQQTLPAIYDDSLSYTDLLAKLLYYVNTLAENNTTLSNDVTNAINYINNYLGSDDFTDQVRKKLDEMASDGTLDKIINEDLFGNLETKINNLKFATTQNSKFMCPLFFDTDERQTEQYIDGYIKLARKLGFGSCQMLAHIDNGVVMQKQNTFVWANKYATMYNVPITSLKVHGTVDSNYISTALPLLDYFPNLKTVFIINEQFEDAKNHTDFVVKIKEKNNKLKVGITADTYQCFSNSPSISPSDMAIVENNFDILGVNFYPSCNNFYSSDLNPDKMQSKINNQVFTLAWNKEIWVTECGVLPYEQFLCQPWQYDFTKITNKTKNTYAQYLFYSCCFNHPVLKNAEIVVPWYFENWYDTNDTEFLNKMKNLILGGNSNVNVM